MIPCRLRPQPLGLTLRPQQFVVPWPPSGVTKASFYGRSINFELEKPSDMLRDEASGGCDSV